MANCQSILEGLPLLSEKSATLDWWRPVYFVAFVLQDVLQTCCCGHCVCVAGAPAVLQELRPATEVDRARPGGGGCCVGENPSQ
jgi:hypothetical protein